MSLFKPAYDATLTLKSEAPGGQAIAGNYFVVSIESFVVNTAAFLGDGSDGVQEGLISLRLSGDQLTTLPYKGEPKVPGKVDDKFLNKLVYLGPVRDQLYFEIGIIESNQETRDLLDNIAKGLQTVGSLLPVVPAPIPVPVGPILALGSSVLHLISANIQDVQECSAKLAVSPDPRKKEFFTGDSISFDCTRKVPVTVPPTAAPVMAQGAFRIHSIKAANLPKGGSYVVLLKNLSFIANSGATISVTVPTTVNSTKGPRPGYKYENKPALDYIFRDMSTFNFEATSGNQKYGQTSSIVIDASGTPSIPDLLWDSCELFDLGLSAATIPLALSFTLNAAKIQVDAINDVLTNTFAVVSSLGAKIPSAVTKEAPSAVSILSDLSPKDLTLYSFNGVVILGEDATVQTNPNGHLILPKTSPTSWERAVTAPDGSPLSVKYNGQAVGILSFSLEVRALPNVSAG
jgi:hypothetical protein